MLKYLIFSLFITFSSFAQKAEYDVINDFLKVELEGFIYDTVNVRMQPLPVSEMFNLYRKAYRERNNQNPNNATVWVIPKIKKWPYTEKNIEAIGKDIDIDNWEWNAKGFCLENFVVKKATVTDDRGFQVSHMNSGKVEYTLKLSRPVFSRDKKHALFLVYFNELLMRGNPFPHSGLVLMKEEKNGWIMLSNIREVVYE